MNGKQARNLRKIVQEEAGSLPLVAYKQEVHNERLRQVGFKTDGSPEYEAFSPVTIRLDKASQRAVYQGLKAVHHTFYERG